MTNNIQIHILNSSKLLDNSIQDIRRVSIESIEQVLKFIPIKDVDIVIYNNPYSVIPEIGIGGSILYDAHTVFICLESDFEDFKTVINKNLPRILAHELNHIARWQAIGHDNTLLDAIVSEGLADHFDQEITGGSIYPWDNAINNDEAKILLEIARKEFHNSDYNHNDWFFGAKEIKRWSGYTVGYKIVGNYLEKNKDKKPSMIYNTPSEEFIAYSILS